MRLLLRCLSFAFVWWMALVAPVTAIAAWAAPGQQGSLRYHVKLAPDGMPPLNIHVEEMGRGPVILLLHGLGGSSYSWRHVAPRLATTHRVIALDLRGFGRSDKPFDSHYGIHDHANVVRAYIRAAKLSRVTLIGHSYGGLVALRLVQDRRLEPHRIARLVVMDSPAFPQPFSGGVTLLRKPVLPYVLLTVVPPEVTTMLALMMESVGFDNVTSRDISIYADPLSEPGGPHALVETALQIVPPDLDRVIAGYSLIQKPTLALWCREDRVVPLSTGIRLSRTIPGARLATVEGCDHLPAEQNPIGVALEIRRFLAR